MAREGWIYSFFGGKDDFYGRAYESRLDDERSELEVELVLELLKPKPGAHLFDWVGGWGRHTIHLAKRGFRVTLLDFCAEYIEKAKEAAAQAGVEIETVCADFRETPSSIQADYAINLFTAGLGYLTEEDDLIALRSLHAALKPKAKVLIDTMNLFWIVKNFQESMWEEPCERNIRFLTKHRFDSWANRIYASAILQDLEAGTEMEREHSERIFSAAGLSRLMRAADFEPVEIYGGLDGTPYGFDTRRLVMISVRS